MTKKRGRRDPEDLALSALTAPDGSSAPAPPDASARPSAPPKHLNVAAYLKHLAGVAPDRVALIAVSRRAPEVRVTFRQLDEETSRLAAALASAGVGPAQRVLVLARSTVETLELACAAWKLGASMVVLPHGTQAEIAAAAGAAHPTVLVGTPRAQLARVLGTSALGSVRVSVSLGPWLPRGVPGGCASLDALVASAPLGPIEIARTLPEHEALVLGSSRGALGSIVVLDQGTVMTRVEALRGIFESSEGTSVAVTSDPAALAVMALGLTAVVRDRGWTARRPSAGGIAALFRAPGVSVAVATSAEWQSLVDHAESTGLVLPPLAGVIVGAASPRLHAQVSRLLQGGETEALFGDASAFPLAAISGSEVRDATASLSARGGGACVGRPNPRAEVALLSPRAAYAPELRDDLRVAAGDVGEVLVRGVLAGSPSTDAEAVGVSVVPAPGGAWLRTGELAWADRQGRLWHCGRAADRIETPRGPLYPACAEAVFDGHPRIARAWIVGRGAVGGQEPVLVVASDVAGDEAARLKLEMELLERAQANPLTSGIRRVLVRPRARRAPSRDEVAAWAMQRLAGGA